MSTPSQPETPAHLVRIEAAALEALAQRLDGPLHDPFTQACTIMVDAAQSNHRVILSGVGKSGLIARKIAATMVSTGIPAQFLHPAEALHGDIGILSRGDVLLALSYSGETEEGPPPSPRRQTHRSDTDQPLRLRHLHARPGQHRHARCQRVPRSLLDATRSYRLDHRHAGARRRPRLPSKSAAPSASKPQDFADLHPGGQLGRRLTTVGKLMHTGSALPSVAPTAAMPDIIHEMSARRLGMTTIQSAGKLLGVISDGDLRRLFERDGPEAFHKTAADLMNPNPLTISPAPLAPDALVLMEQRKITALVVTEDGTPNTPVQGVLHIHDLWEVAPPAA